MNFNDLKTRFISYILLVKNNLQAYLKPVVSSEFTQGTFLAIVVGITTGLGAVFFRWLIGVFQNLFFIEGAKLLSFAGQYYVIILPAIGGLLVGLLVYFTKATETKGHGVPEVMEAVARRGGRIRTRVAAVKILASSLTIGSGGSAGREGPIVQIGSTIGSILAQRLHLSTEWIKTLVACGAAGGISATFNAPIAGVFFAHEIILGRIFTRHFGFVVIGSVIADVIAHAFLGNTQTFSIPTYTINDNIELVLYFLLGIIAAFVAIAFIRILYKSEDIFDGLKMPVWVKPALGGLFVGLIGLYSHDLFGVGYDGVEQALLGNIALISLVIMLVLKIAATSFTLGSGGSGGVFAPSLFMGAMLGGAFGKVAGLFWPNIVAPSGAYALVGMAAVFAGAARAPITAIIILFEMTRNYAIILPLMIAVVVSTLIAQSFHPESIYTVKLKRRGIDLSAREEVDLLEKVRVESVMTREYPKVSPDMPVSSLMEEFTKKTRHHGFPVVDQKGKLVGMVTLTDVEQRMTGNTKDLKVSDIATTNLIVTYPDETLHDVIHRVGTVEIGRIPVVTRRDHSKMVGILRRQDFIRAYTKALRHSSRPPAAATEVQNKEKEHG